MASEIGRSVDPSWVAAGKLKAIGGLRGFTEDEEGFVSVNYSDISAMLDAEGYGFSLNNRYGAQETLQHLRLWWMSRDAEVRVGQLRAHGYTAAEVDDVVAITQRMRIDEVNNIALPAVVFSILDLDSALARAAEAAPAAPAPGEAAKPPRPTNVEAGMSKAWPWFLGAGAIVGLIWWGSK